MFVQGTQMIISVYIGTNTRLRDVFCVSLKDSVPTPVTYRGQYHSDKIRAIVMET
jgi:hypothetical protein